MADAGSCSDRRMDSSSDCEENRMEWSMDDGERREGFEDSISDDSWSDSFSASPFESDRSESGSTRMPESCLLYTLTLPTTPYV